MRKKIPLLLLILMCFCAVTVLSSCDAILDLIFGSTTPPEPQHVHSMEQKMFSGDVCTEQSEIKYYKCSDCGKCYLDKNGTEQINEEDLATGHLYVLRHNDIEHYLECNLCHTVKEGSSAKHSPWHYCYNANEHYKQCDECDAVFDRGEHDSNLSCNVCGRQADYETMCNGRYGYERLAVEFKNNGEKMQKLYDKIDSEVKSAHNDANYNFELQTFKDRQDYGLSIDCANYQLSNEEAYAVAVTYRNDNPLYYWLGSHIGLESHKDLLSGDIYTDSVKISVDSNYRSGADRVAENANIYSEIDSYLSYVSDESKTYYITLSLHDKIIDDIDYAYQEDGVTVVEEAWAHSILGAFKYKFAVCDGYAKAFQLLLNACNVNNALFAGTSLGENHAWNAVQLGDEWYWYDLTWDDQPSVFRGVIYNYFCATNDNFTKDHKVSVIKTGIDYMYNAPTVAIEAYQTEGLELNEYFTKDGFTYQFIGHNRLAVNKCLLVGEDKVATIPATVTQDGRIYKVAQINDEAFATYTRDKDGKITSITSPSIIKVVIPSTVDMIYNKSFTHCKTIVMVEFANTSGWLRYPTDGNAPKYEEISSDRLSNEFSASFEIRKAIDNYNCVWVNFNI